MSPPLSDDLLPLTFLAGGGEMGARMREMEWSATPLGPPDTWPHALRSTVSMLLSSKAQIILFWGPEFTVLYNDAYRPVFGAKHPWALGQPGRLTWSEIWETQLHALLDGVVRTGEAFQARDLRFEIERHGFLEETYFDVSYDPVRVDAGSVGGVFCIVTETTERVVGERRLALLRDLAARNATARTERDALVLAMETLSASPDVAFALAYLDEELQAATPDAEARLAATAPEQVKVLSIRSAAGGRHARLLLGLNPRRPFDEGYRRFVDLVVDQLAGALTNARVREAERQHIADHEQAAAAKAYLAAIVDSADDVIIAKDLDGVIQSCNRAAERLFGYSSQELIGKPVRILIPPERQAEEDEILARLRRGERIEHFETVRVRKDGRLLDVDLTISPVCGEDGRIIGVSKIGRDITALKQAETDRIRLIREHAAVTETLNHVGAIVTSDLDRDKVVQAVVDAATELTAAELGAFCYEVTDERGDVCRLRATSGVPFEISSVPRMTELFEPASKGAGVVRSDDITTDLQYGPSALWRGRLPEYLVVRSYLVAPVKGRGGDVIGGLFFGHSAAGRFDTHHERIVAGIASWASVALENARLYAAARDASRIKDEFLASLSHELRTPLNAILGYARILQSGLVGPDKQEKAIETIERNATSLARIVDDVLDISRIVSGKIRLNIQPVDFPTIVRHAVEAIAPAADAKGVRIETVIEPAEATVSGDPDRLQQILWNLLSNAVKFTPRGGHTQVRLARKGFHVELTVTDTGIGISPEFLPHVFERFRQGDARQRDGLGLGLSIARQLTEMHGGTIEVASDGLGHGATFRVRMPLADAGALHGDIAPGQVRPRSSAVDTGAVDLEGLHVLAVDDEPDALALVREVLEAAGARVTMAQSAEEALHRVEAVQPDLVVADLRMPRMDGFDFISRLRRHDNPRVRDIPAVALTAYVRAEDQMKVLQTGFHAHLAKPLDPTALLAAIMSLAPRIGMNGTEISPDVSLT